MTAAIVTGGVMVVLGTLFGVVSSSDAVDSRMAGVVWAWICTGLGVSLLLGVILRLEHDLDQRDEWLRESENVDQRDGQILVVLGDDDEGRPQVEWTTEAELHQRAGHVETTSTTTITDTTSTD